MFNAMETQKHKSYTKDRLVWFAGLIRPILKEYKLGPAFQKNRAGIIVIIVKHDYNHHFHLFLL